MKIVWFTIFLIVGIVRYVLCINYPNNTIMDTNRHILKMVSTGELTIKFDGTSTTPTVTQGVPAMTVRDTDGDALKINTNGSINIKGE